MSFFILLLILLISSKLSLAGTIFFTDESLWLNSVSSPEIFLTSSTNLTSAIEITIEPGFKSFLKNQLTFDSSNTGLSIDFSLSTVQPDAQLLYDDHPYHLPVWQDSLSIGQINHYEDDDWEINILSNSINAFGFDLVGNHGGDDSISFFDSQDNLISSFTDLPAPGDYISFIGVITDDSISRIFYDDDSGYDDIAIANFRFQSAAPVPEPSTFLLLGGGLSSLAWYRRKRKGE